MFILIQHLRIKVGYSLPPKKTLWDSNPRFQIDMLVTLTFYRNIFRTSAVSSTDFGSILIFESCLLVQHLLVIYDVGNFFLNGRGPILL